MHSELVDKRILSQLNRQIKSGKWATTYLFTGKELEKKKALAISFAKALNCKKGKVGSDCDCTICRRIDEGTHPDVKWYGFDEDAATIKISEVRDFKNWLSFKSFEADVKVFIFNQAQRLSNEAQNALLKSLEEPPPGNVIILIVERSESLFDTIVSRSIEIKVPSLSSKDLKEVLIKEGVSQHEAEFLARFAQGELKKAQEAVHAKWFTKKNQWIDALVKAPVTFMEQFQTSKRDELVRVFDFLIEWFRDVLAYSASRDAQYLIHYDRASLIESVAQKSNFDSIVNALDELYKLKNSLNDYANQKLVITQVQILLDSFFNL